MTKKIINLLLLLLVLILIIFYLSFFGLKTDKFNDKIQSEISNINKKVNLELKDITILLSPRSLSINIKTSEPVINFNNQQLKLEYIKTNISIKSLIYNNFSIDDLQISTKAIKLKNLVSLVRSFKMSTELFILEKIITDGFLVGNIKLNFDNNGEVKKNYEVSGFIKNGKLDFFKRYTLEDTDLIFNIKNNNYFIKDISTKFNQIKFSSPLINKKKKNDLFFVNGKLINSEKEIDIRFVKKLLAINTKNKLNIKNINLTTNSEFTFNINKKLKIGDINIKSILSLEKLTLKDNFLNLKKYLPNLDQTIELTDHKIKINYNKNRLDINGKGKFLIGNKLDLLDYKIRKKDNLYIFDTNIDIKANPLIIKILNYEKNEDIVSLLKLNGIYKVNKEIQFNLISLIENNNNFIVKDLILNNELKILDIDTVKLNFENTNNLNNRINIQKNQENYQIKGKVFDASKLIDVFFDNKETNSNSILSNNINTNIDIKIDKIYLDDEYFISNLDSKINLINSKIENLNLNSNYENDKQLTLSINHSDGKKITTLFSDHAKPFIKKYSFIKGFDEGSLDFYSIKKNNISTSKLKIYNFKLQELPALTKLLTLASLQGIADILTGEGIRFSEFEMSFNNDNNLMTINEIYAIGPAVSVLMEGYVEDSKLVSLRGTLVPATTINKAIGSIPVLGNILVGKKVGEGVFGVSFKIKGQLGDLKTTVNPIKTLTPRFITRTLEKIKKN